MPLIVDDRERVRRRAMQRMLIEQGRRAFEARFAGSEFAQVVVLVCAYNEVRTIGQVLGAIPDKACGLPVSALVVVDGGDDGTADVASRAGVPTLVLPVNLGHGIALRVGYDVCLDKGAEFVVTIDADGQNDPAELPDMLAPLVDDEADMVVGSRRLGVDETSDAVRRAGVRLYAGLVNRLMGVHLTDTSSGYRALRATMLQDVTRFLDQEQYQTAELLITAIARGWRVTERPTVWHPRAAGSSKKGSNALFGARYATVVLGTWWRARRLR